MSERRILRVAVNAPLHRLFDYLPPDESAAARPGCRIKVPFGRRRECAMVFEVAADSDLPESKLRRSLEILDESPLLDERDLWLMRFVSDYYHHPPGEVVAAALPALLRQGRPLYSVIERLRATEAGLAADRDALAKTAPRQAALLARLRQRAGMTAAELDDEMPGWKRQRKGLLEKGFIVVEAERENPEVGARRNMTPQQGPPLNGDQSAALAALRERPGFQVHLLDGVTGSGKTEVYLRLIESVLDRDRQVLVLVPEIGLTPQFVARLELRLGIEPVLLHSSLSDATRLAAWRAARDGSASLIRGARAA